MAEYREILARTVVGRGRKNTIENHDLKTDNNADKALGCWIINHQYFPYILDSNTIAIEGSYDVHVWYSFNNNLDTAIAKKTIKYKEEIPFKMKKNEVLGVNNDLKAFMIKYPTCIDMVLENNTIHINVEKEFVVDSIGETKIKVQISKEYEDDWIIDNEIDNSINPNYIIDNNNN